MDGDDVKGHSTETASRTGSAPTEASVDEALPRLIVVCECRRLTSPGLRVDLRELDEITIGRGAERILTREGRVARISVPDDEMSRKHLSVRYDAAGWEAVDLGSKNGIVVNGDRVRIAVLTDGDLIEAGNTLLMLREDGTMPDANADHDLSTDVEMPAAFRTLSFELERRIKQLTRVARADVPVLLRGETGTGKELAARAIHDASKRRGAFVAINCGAIPRNLIESQLFGHKRGAFSGAHEEREGLVRRAHNGTLFLDEIAELPEESQVALLRVLQEGEVRPLGATDPISVDVRIVAATHQDIPARVADGRFRKDLYARLAGFEVGLPALRDRREDIGTMISVLLPRLAASSTKLSLQRSAARALLRYPWPLNIRELEQALRTAIALSEDGEIRHEHLPEAIRTYAPPSVASMRREDRVLRQRVIELLCEHDGNIAAVGRAMGKAPIQVRRWCQRLQIELSKFRG